MNEPIAIINSVKDFVRFALLFIVGMGWLTMTSGQQEQFMLMIAALGLVVDQAVTWYTRSQVTPMRRFRPRVQDAINAGRQAEVRAPILPKPVTPPLPDHPVT